jgi:hypothetical protein
MGHELHPIAYAQDGHREIEKPRVAGWCLGLIDAGRSPGEDQALRREGLNGLRGGGIGEDLTIYLGLSHAPGDELGILRSEVQNQHLFGMDICQGDPKGEMKKSRLL